MMLEKLSHMVWLPPNVLNGTPNGNLNYECPNYLPDPCYICGVSLLEQSAVPTAGDAILMVKMDHEGRFFKSTGFPASEICSAADPNCHSQLMRLAVLDFRPGAIREVYKAHNPVVRWSRAKGDLLQINGAGFGGVQIQICVSVEYLRPGTYTPNDEMVLPPISLAPPPPSGFGTWLNASFGTGRTVNATDPNFAFRFTAPASGNLSTARFRAVVVRSGASVQGVLLDASGTQIGSPSSIVSVNAAEEFMVTFPGDAAVLSSTGYWVKFVPVSGTLDADIDVCADDVGYQSWRGTNGVPTNNLPSGDDWRVNLTLA